MVAIVCQNAALDVPSSEPQSAMLENPLNPEPEVEVLGRRSSDELVEKASRTSLLGSTGLMDESMSEYEEDMEPEEEEDIVEIFKKKEEAKSQQTKTLSLDEKLERFNRRQPEKNSNNKSTPQKNRESTSKSTLQKNLESLDKKAQMEAQQESSLEQDLDSLNNNTQRAHKPPRRVVSTGTKRNKLTRSLSLDGSKRHSWDGTAKTRKGKKPDFRWDKFKGGDEAENDSGEFRWDKLGEGCGADSPPSDRSPVKRTITPPPPASKKKEDSKPAVTASPRPQIRPSRKPVRRTKSLSCSLESRLRSSLSQTKRPILQRTNSKVRFCMDSEVFEVPRCTKDMKPDLFYTKKEIKTFKAEKKEEKRELKQQKKLEKEKARARSKSPTPPKPIERVSSAPVSFATTASSTTTNEGSSTSPIASC